MQSSSTFSFLWNWNIIDVNWYCVEKSMQLCVKWTEVLKTGIFSRMKPYTRHPISISFHSVFLCYRIWETENNWNEKKYDRNIMYQVEAARRFTKENESKRKCEKMGKIFLNKAKKENWRWRNWGRRRHQKINWSCNASAFFVFVFQLMWKLKQLLI